MLLLTVIISFAELLEELACRSKKKKVINVVPDAVAAPIIAEDTPQALLSKAPTASIRKMTTSTTTTTITTTTTPGYFLY